MKSKKLKIVVIGGGSSYTPELIEGIINRRNQFPVGEVCLVDLPEAEDKLNIIKSYSERMIKRAAYHIKITTSFDRREAIKNADFVMTQFRTGGLKARHIDESIPLKYNKIGQETTGAGGFAMALRTIPVMLDICKDIEELAPNAWMLNFTNPAGLVTEAIQKHTKVKTIGVCNVPMSMRMMTAQMFKCNQNEVKLNFAGLNHLVWITKAYLHGADITSQLLDKIADGANFNMKNIFEEPWDSEFIKALGAIPCPYHRYYYQTHAMLEEELSSAKEKGTRAMQVAETEASLFKLYQDESLDVKPAELEQRGGAYYSDVSLNLVDAIYNNLNTVHVVNVTNHGAIPTLASDAVIECSCIVGSNGPTPLATDPLPNHILSLIHHVKSYETLTVEAAVEGNLSKALMALTIHPLVADANIAQKILKDILRENALPQFG